MVPSGRTLIAVSRTLNVVSISTGAWRAMPAAEKSARDCPLLVALELGSVHMKTTVLSVPSGDVGA